MDLYEDFTEEQTATFQTGRNWVLSHVADPGTVQSAAQKLALLDAILTNNQLAAHETAKLQSLGIVFGDALAQELPLLSWKMVTSRFGRV